MSALTEVLLPDDDAARYPVRLVCCGGVTCPQPTSLNLLSSHPAEQPSPPLHEGAHRQPETAEGNRLACF